jgi:phosphoribosylglycinamide formyltransferase-1
MGKFNVAVLISGNGSNLQALIDKFASSSLINICCVISNEKEAYGLERARNANINTHFIDHKAHASREDFEKKLIVCLDKYSPNLIVLAGFMRILSNLFVEEFKGKLINIHPSLLPKYKGLDTHKRVIEAKEQYHGVTVHFVDNTLDGGPICAQSQFKVTTNNIKELEKEIHKLEHELYPAVVNEIATKKIFLSDGEVIRKQ